MQVLSAAVCVGIKAKASRTRIVRFEMHHPISDRQYWDRPQRMHWSCRDYLQQYEYRSRCTCSLLWCGRINPYHKLYYPDNRSFQQFGDFDTFETEVQGCNNRPFLWVEQGLSRTLVDGLFARSFKLFGGVRCTQRSSYRRPRKNTQVLGDIKIWPKNIITAINPRRKRIGSIPRHLYPTDSEIEPLRFSDGCQQIRSRWPRRNQVSNMLKSEQSWSHLLFLIF